MAVVISAKYGLKNAVLRFPSRAPAALSMTRRSDRAKVPWSKDGDDQHRGPPVLPPGNYELDLGFDPLPHEMELEADGNRPDS